MKSMAMWSALGGGAACVVVAGFAIESAGGFAPLLAKFNPPAQILAPSPAKPAPAPSPSVDQAAPPKESSGLPAFDVVRVEKTGDAVIAGRAEPHASVELRDDGKALGRIDADEGGQFVIVPDPLATGDHRLQLAARVGDGPEALSKIVPVTVEAATAMAKPVAPKPTPTAAPTLAIAAKPSPTPSPALAQAPKPSPSPSPTLAAVPKATPSPVVVAAAPRPSPTVVAVAEPSPSPKAPREPAPSVVGRLGVAKVRTTDASGLEAEGSADPGARLRLKLNGSFVAEVTANSDGHWRLSIDRGLTSGFYALRAEALDAYGRASSAAEMTFAFAQRTAPSPAPVAATKDEPSPAPRRPDLGPAATPAILSMAAPTPAPAETRPTAAPAPPAPQPEPEPRAAETSAADPSHAMVAEILTTTVAKGDNLWDLARHYYGDGLRYADIYRANAEQIHNPNLIFIGQVFVVPQSETKTP